MFEFNDTQKIGLAMLVIGCGFLMLGVVLLFDSGLLALGNFLFLLGLGVLTGPQKCFRLFFQKHKIKGTTFFFLGILVVLFRWPIIGMCLEAYGFFLLFSGFFPVVINFIYRIPVVGWIICLPGINKITNYLGGGQSKSMV